jgi:hypothetical protein
MTCSLSWLGTGTSIKSGGVKLVPKTSLLSETIVINMTIILMYANYYNSYNVNLLLYLWVPNLSGHGHPRLV